MKNRNKHGGHKKSTIDKRKISAHTKRFRALYAPNVDENGCRVNGQHYIGDSPPVIVRSLTHVGGSRPTAYRHRGSGTPTIPLARIAAIPPFMRGMVAMATATLKTLLPKSKRELKRFT